MKVANILVSYGRYEPYPELAYWVKFRREGATVKSSKPRLNQSMKQHPAVTVPNISHFCIATESSCSRCRPIFEYICRMASRMYICRCNAGILGSTGANGSRLHPGPIE